MNRSNNELSQFAFIASHDLQEPLRKIILYSDHLLNEYVDKVDKKGEGYLKNMMESSQRMRSLIQDILTIAAMNFSIKIILHYFPLKSDILFVFGGKEHYQNERRIKISPTLTVNSISSCAGKVRPGKKTT